MKNGTKGIIIKVIIVCCCIFDSLSIIIPIISVVLKPEYDALWNEQMPPLPEPYYTIWIINLILCLVFGILLIILLPIFGLKTKAVKPEKIQLSFLDYNSLSNHITNSAKDNGYIQSVSRLFFDNGILTMYVKQKRLWSEDCIALIRVLELTDDILKSANSAITECLKDYYGTEKITNTVNMITIICVDRITPCFQKFVNCTPQQGLKNGRLPVGISFGGHAIYIPRQIDGFAVTKHKQLRAEFLHIVSGKTGDGSLS